MLTDKITVAELIKLLQQEDPDRIVMLTGDPDGNSSGPAEGIWTAAYSPEEDFLGLEKLDPESEAEGYTEDDVVPGGIPVLVISPGYW